MTKTFDLGKVEVSSTPRERFEEYLQTHNMRMTQQRREILEEVYQQHEHFDADELYDSLQRSKRGERGVSRPTIYRTLKELAGAGLLRKMTLGRRVVYEHDYGYPQHEHLYCEKCKKLIEFSSEELVRIRDAVAAEHHFRPTGHHLIIRGLCADCAKPKRRRRPLEAV